MKKPVIGVTPSHEPDSSEINVRFSYLDAVAAGGGIPLVFPLKLEQEDILRLASLCDGFLFTGGPDVHPFRFGEDTHEKCGNVSLYRDSLELALLKIAMEQTFPLPTISHFTIPPFPIRWISFPAPGCPSWRTALPPSR